MFLLLSISKLFLLKNESFATKQLLKFLVEAPTEFLLLQL